MLNFTCTMISSADIVHYGVSRAEDWISVDCSISATYTFPLCLQCERQSQYLIVHKMLPKIQTAFFSVKTNFIANES